MTMTEVITGLRDLNPCMQAAVENVAAQIDRAVQLAKDGSACRTPEGLKALADAELVAVLQLAVEWRGVQAVAERLDHLTNSYTREFRRERGLPVENPAQMTLPLDDADRRAEELNEPSEGDVECLSQPREAGGEG